MCTRSWNVSCLQPHSDGILPKSDSQPHSQSQYSVSINGDARSARSSGDDDDRVYLNGDSDSSAQRNQSQSQNEKKQTKRALIILNQPFSPRLLRRVWATSQWHCCADGGANRLHDTLVSQAFGDKDGLTRYKPDLIKGDLDSLRSDVHEYYAAQGVKVLRDESQDSTDLMKCMESLQAKERAEGGEYEVVILGGLCGRLDQTIHTLSYLHKLRKTRKSVMAVTDDNIGWVLDAGKHEIHIDHSILGPTCGLLPVGVEETILTTSGLRWNLDNYPSGFDGLVSTSNHLVEKERIVRIETSKPIWWTVELR